MSDIDDIESLKKTGSKKYKDTPIDELYEKMKKSVACPDCDMNDITEVSDEIGFRTMWQKAKVGLIDYIVKEVDNANKIEEKNLIEVRKNFKISISDQNDILSEIVTEERVDFRYLMDIPHFNTDKARHLVAGNRLKNFKVKMLKKEAAFDRYRKYIKYLTNKSISKKEYQKLLEENTFLQDQIKNLKEITSNEKNEDLKNIIEEKDILQGKNLELNNEISTLKDTLVKTNKDLDLEKERNLNFIDELEKYKSMENTLSQEKVLKNDKKDEIILEKRKEKKEKTKTTLSKRKNIIMIILLAIFIIGSIIGSILYFNPSLISFVNSSDKNIQKNTNDTENFNNSFEMDEISEEDDNFEGIENIESNNDGFEGIENIKSNNDGFEGIEEMVPDIKEVDTQKEIIESNFSKKKSTREYVNPTVTQMKENAKNFKLIGDNTILYNSKKYKKNDEMYAYKILHIDSSDKKVVFYDREQQKSFELKIL